MLYVKGIFEDHRKRMYGTNMIEKVAEKLVSLGENNTGLILPIHFIGLLFNIALRTFYNYNFNKNYLNQLLQNHIKAQAVKRR